MTEYEAYELSMQYVSFAHELGEATNRQTEFWSGVSFALLAITFVSPKSLTRTVTVFILTLYLLFSVSSGVNMGFDIETARSSMRDAENVLSQHNLSSMTLEEKTRASTDNKLSIMRGLSALYMPGLFFGTIGYVVLIHIRESRRSTLDKVA